MYIVVNYINKWVSHEVWRIIDKSSVLICENKFGISTWISEYPVFYITLNQRGYREESQSRWSEQKAGRLFSPIYLRLIFPILQSGISSWIFFQVWTAFFVCKIQVWIIKLAKSKIPVRVVKNVISKWKKMDFLRFLSFWFIAVAVVNPPDQKLVMYISVDCRKGVNS